MASRSSQPTRLNRWWIPSEGIARVVISADIQRYLGPDAVVKPGDGINENEGIPGYWITAPRTLTTEMIQDLKLDTQRWEQEQREAGRRGSPNVREGKSSRHPDFSVGQQETAPSYEASATHRSRHYYGPSSADTPHQAPVQPARSTYSSDPSSHYTTNPAGHYAHGSASNQSPYPPQPTPYGSHAAAPRTVSAASPYSQYPHAAPRQDYPAYASPQQYSYPSSATPSAYSPHVHNPYSPHSHSAHPPPPTQQPQHPPQRRTARPGYYIASDGNEYRIPPGGIPGQQ